MQRLGGSSVKRWSVCHWSVNGELPIETSSEAAEEGTEVHAQVEAYLKGESETYPEQCKEYVDFVESLEATFMYIECKVQHPHVSFMGGTADFIADYEGKIIVADYKNGLVPVTDFRQQLYYGCLWQLKNYGYLDKEIHCFTFQPNSLDGVTTRAQIYSVDDCCDFIEEVEQAAKVISEGSEHAEVGEHCRYCKASANCKTIRDWIGEKMEKKVFNQLAECLDSLPIIKQWVDYIEVQAMAAIKAGDSVPGYTVEPTRPRRHWKPEALDVLKIAVTEEEFKEISKTELKPITTVEKVLGKKFIKGFVFSESKGEKVVKLNIGGLDNVEVE